MTAHHLLPIITKPYTVADAYGRVAEDLTTYTVARCGAKDLRLGVVFVDEHGVAEGVIVAECYGTRTWMIAGTRGGVETVTFDRCSSLRVAAGVAYTWEDSAEG